MKTIVSFTPESLPFYEKTISNLMRKIKLTRLNHLQPEFFIAGAQRSGTTLLRLILNQHSQICIPEEATFLMPLLNDDLDVVFQSDWDRKTLMAYLRNNAQFSKWGMDLEGLDKIVTEHVNTRTDMIRWLYTEYASQQKKSICGDKTPSFIRKIGSLRKINPEAKVLLLVRDGRDVFLSLKNKGHRISKTPALAALDWCLKTYIADRQLNRHFPNRYHLLRYEDLIADPESTVKRLLGFLDLSYEEKILNFWQHSDDNIERSHSDLIFKPIENQNREKWRSLMTVNDRLAFDLVAGRQLSKYGYETAPFWARLKMLPVVFLQLFFTSFQRLLNISSIALGMKRSASKGSAVGQEYYS